MLTFLSDSKVCSSYLNSYSITFQIHFQTIVTENFGPWRAKKNTFTPGSCHQPGLEVSFARALFGCPENTSSPGWCYEPGLEGSPGS